MKLVKHYQFGHVAVYVGYKLVNGMVRMRVEVFHFTDHVVFEYTPGKDKRLDVLVAVLTGYDIPEKETIKIAQEVERIGAQYV